MEMDYQRILNDIRRGRLPHVGSGAGRNVYDMGNGYVVKVAKNGFGMEQNRNEHHLSLLYNGNLLARVMSVSDDHRMLVMQAAESIRNMKPVLDYFHVGTRKALYFAPELVDLARTHRLVHREFLWPRNWGLIGKRPVIIDYGFIMRRRRRRLI